MQSSVTGIQFDEALSEGARNAINVCLRLKPEEKITVIADNESIEIAASLVHEIEKVGSKYELFVLEDFSPRPLKEMPEEILQGLESSKVSIFCAVPQQGELTSRIQMTKVIDRQKIRHATW